MSTVTILQTLLGILHSRKNKYNPTGTVSASASIDPAQSSPTESLNPAVDPLNPLDAPGSGATLESNIQQNGPNNPLSPSSSEPVEATPGTEQALRQQLRQADLYDLSGEKAAAEALQRDDAFQQQQIDQKAEQTKEFFASQDQKQNQTLQEVKQQADQQLHDQQEKQFWDQKKSTEMQAGMNKELLGLHEAARQAHQEWRNDFTEGVCRDDVAALYNKDITDRVGQYKARLDDIGSNPVDKVQTIEKYKVKLTDEAAPQVEEKTAELHQEHFPEFHGGQGGGPTGPGGHPPDNPEEFWPGGKAKPGESWPGGLAKPGESWPQGAEEEHVEEKKEPFFKDIDNTKGPNWLDGPPKDTTDDTFFSNPDRMRTRTGQDIPEGWMKPIDPPLSEQFASKAREWGKSVAEAAKSENGIEAGIHAADHLAGDMQGAEHGLGLPGLPSDVSGQAIAWAKIAYEHGPEGLKASAMNVADNLKESGEAAWEKAKQYGQDLKEAASQAGKTALESVERFSGKGPGAAETAVDPMKAAPSEALEAAQPDSGGQTKLTGQDAELVRMLQSRSEDLGTRYTGPKAEDFAKSIAQKNQEQEIAQLSPPKQTLLLTDQRPEQKLITDQSQKPLLLTDQSPKPLLLTDQRSSAPEAAPTPAIQPPKPQGL
jgi:hypothetical protein